MERLHPTGGPYNTPKFVYDKESHGPLPSAADVVRKATSLAPLRAPGSSGWTKELLVPILQEDDPRDVVTWIIQGIPTNPLPPTMRDFLTGANLKLFNKPGAPVGHHSSYRPIAMRGGILKLAGLLALEQVRDHLPAVFQGLQFGAQYTQGCEHVVVRDHFRDRPDEVTAAVEVENAFNSISRAAIFRALKRYPNLSPMIGISLFGYGTPSKLHLREGIAIPSSRGVKQGDPMAPILFALGIQGAISTVAAKYSGCLKLWAYLDDKTIAAEPGVCVNAFDSLEEEIKFLGLKLNTAKCMVATRHPDLYSVFSGSRMQHAPGGVKLLGAYIGATEAVEEGWVLSKVPKATNFFGITGDKKIHPVSRPCCCRHRPAPAPSHIASEGFTSQAVERSKEPVRNARMDWAWIASFYYYCYQNHK